MTSFNSSLGRRGINTNDASGPVEIDRVTEIGDIEAGNKTVFENDGTLRFDGDSTVWDDLKESAIARNLDTTSGRIDYNFAEATVDFADNARYAATEQLTLAMQMSHSYKHGSNMEPHVHWIQNQDKIPNWLMEYRVLLNGEAATPTFLKAICSEQIFTYTSGTILQICEFPLIPGVSSLSFSVDVKIYRDTGNTSLLFSGVDDYVGPAALKFFDIHYIKDTIGSREEFIK